MMQIVVCECECPITQHEPSGKWYHDFPHPLSCGCTKVAPITKGA